MTRILVETGLLFIFVEEVGEHDPWDFVWADREWIYSAFDKMHLENWQRLNHYRNGRELCRKVSTVE